MIPLMLLSKPMSWSLFLQHRAMSQCVEFNHLWEVCYGFRDAHVPIFRLRYIVQQDVHIVQLKLIGSSKDLRLRMRGHDDTDAPINLVGYSDADFAAGKSHRKSVTGGFIEVAGMPVLQFTRKQSGVSLSTMEAEYTAASVVVAEMIAIKELIGELGISCVSPMSLKVDNQTSLKLLGGESSSKSKHIHVRIKFVVHTPNVRF